MIDQQEAPHVYGDATGRGGITRLFAGMVDRRMSLLLFLLVFFCYSYFVQIDGWNQKSRMALIMSIVHHHQLNIDSYEQYTGDKALYNGHYYSDKAIGTAVLGVPVYAVYREVRGFEDDGRLHNSYPVTVMVVALPSAILSVLLYQLLWMMAGSRTWALLLSLLYSFGTLAFPFSTMLFGHQVAAVFAFAAFYALFTARLHHSSAWLLLSAGTLAGLAVLVEYQVVLIATFLFLYAATFVRPKCRLGLYILGGAPWAVLLLVYN
jgi:4-amino-4-deoxy-L-arabinose transferase-like glycosyltransferase